MGKVTGQTARRSTKKKAKVEMSKFDWQAWSKKGQQTCDETNSKPKELGPEIVKKKAHEKNEEPSTLDYSNEGLSAEAKTLLGKLQEVDCYRTTFAFDDLEQYKSLLGLTCSVSDLVKALISMNEMRQVEGTKVYQVKGSFQIMRW